jgi:hypothetical protein
MRTSGSFPRIKLPGKEVDHSPPASAEVKENVDLYIHSPIHLRGIVFNLSTGTILPFYHHIKIKICTDPKHEIQEGGQDTHAR